MQQDRIIRILSDRIRQLELEKAYMMDEIITLEDKLKEVETNGNEPVEQ